MSSRPAQQHWEGIERVYTLSDKLARQQWIRWRQDLVAVLCCVRCFLTHILSHSREIWAAWTFLRSAFADATGYVSVRCCVKFQCQQFHFTAVVISYRVRSTRYRIVFRPICLTRGSFFGLQTRPKATL